MKNVLVTGATKGIGREIAILLSENYNVFVIDITFNVSSTIKNF